MKKLVDIVALIKQVNESNKNPDTGTFNRHFRLGQNAMLENLLHSTGCYAGFGYYRAHELPKDAKAGIIFDEKNHDHEYPDDSRVWYNIHKKLQS